MDPQFQRSFIPKKPIVAATSSVRSTVSLLSVIATVVFIVALALAGAVFFYENLLQKSIDTDQLSLTRAKDAFEPETINQIIRLDTRIETGKKLLASHVSLTPFFNLLSQVTLPSVRFKDFSFSYLAPDKVSAIMKGQAESYSAVALQSDVFNQQKYLKGNVVSDLALDPQGTVSFSVTTTIDPTLVSYPANNDQASAAQTATPPARTASPAASTTAATNTPAQ